MVTSNFRTAYFAFLIVAVLGMVFSQGSVLWALWRISADPVATVGHVIRVYCPDHGHIEYSFEIGDTSHSGRNRFIDGINCPDIKVGQPIAVYYENGAPANNYGLYPAEMTGNRARTAFFTGVAFFGAFILLGPLFLASLWTFASRLTGKPKRVA
jgi:hypothetical protein